MIRNIVHFWRDMTYAADLFFRDPRCPWRPDRRRVPAEHLEQHYRSVHAGDTIGRRPRLDAS